MISFDGHNKSKKRREAVVGAVILALLICCAASLGTASSSLLTCLVFLPISKPSAKWLINMAFISLKTVRKVLEAALATRKPVLLATFQRLLSSLPSPWVAMGMAVQCSRITTNGRLLLNRIIFMAKAATVTIMFVSA